MAGRSFDFSDEVDDQKIKRINNKAARLIIRNLPFTCSDEDIHEHFSKFGTLEEVTLLRKNGRLVGCGFIQFNKRFDASEALKATNGNPFLGRPIIVDWAIPKDQYCSVKYEKDDKHNQEDLSKPTVSRERKIKSVNQKFSQEELDERTVFFKDIPFQINNEELKNCAESLAGPVEYAVICIDPLTGLSKGTGFVRFMEKEVANKVINNEIILVLSGKEISSHKMLSKMDLEKAKSNRAASKDKRNLYLIKEGVILAGSLASKGVSKSDMDKRLFLEQQRSKALRNLHKFVSPTRLVIYNLPFRNFDNKKLLQLFKKHSSKGAVINEARVMRNLKNLDDKGIPVSKGYGYVSFEEHQHALAALRTLNNNPNIFTEKKRPIVSFSIEDKKALLLKKRRQEKLNFQKRNADDNIESNKFKFSKINSSSNKNNIGKTKNNKSDVSNLREHAFGKSNTKEKVENKKIFKTRPSTPFVGTSARPGKVKLSNKKLRAQYLLHKVNIKKDKLKQKMLKNKLSRKQRRQKKKSM